MAKIKMMENVYFEGFQYVKDEVYDVSDSTAAALGSSAENTKEKPKSGEPAANNSPEARQERDIKHEPDDAQKTPDAEKDEDPKAKELKEKAAQAPTNKQVEGSPKNK